MIRTAKGPLVTLPYTVELNDIPMMIVQHHESDHLYKRVAESFERLYEESKDRPKFMAIAIHPYISGQPFRIKALERSIDHIAQVRWRAALERRADSRLVCEDGQCEIRRRCLSA